MANATAISGTLPAGQRKQVLAAVDRLNRNNVAIERARLTEHIYSLGKSKKVPPPFRGNSDVDTPDGWELQELYKDKNGNPVYFHKDKDTSFAYSVYTSKFEKPPKPVLVFRGTDNEDSALPDWQTNGVQGVGMESEQYKQSMERSKIMKQKYGSGGFDIAGHSKAGGQAAAGSIVTGADGYTYNAAGVHDNTVNRRDGKSRDDAARIGPDGHPLVEAYNFKHDILSNAQDGLAHPPASWSGTSKVARWWRRLENATDVMPSAAGKRYVLPPVDADGKPVTFNPTKWVDYHGMPYLINSMEYQKGVDQAILGSI